MKKIILTKKEMIRINFLEKQGLFALIGVVDLADKLAVTNGYFSAGDIINEVASDGR